MGKIEEFKKKLEAGIKEGKSFSEILGEEKGVYKPDGLAYEIAKESKINLTQLRKLFAEVTRIEKEARKVRKEELDMFQHLKEKLDMLQPLLAYSVARKLIEKKVYDLFSLMFDSKLYSEDKDIEKMGDFMRAIVAYAKFVEEKKKGGGEE